MNEGLLLIDKSPGLTSHDVVQRVRRILKLRRVGHCGTLDPSATGLLVTTLGKATRLTRFLVRAPKVYCSPCQSTMAYLSSAGTSQESHFPN